MNIHALRQDVCRGLIITVFNDGENFSGSARNRLMPLGQDFHHLHGLGRFGWCVFQSA